MPRTGCRLPYAAFYGMPGASDRARHAAQPDPPHPQSHALPRAACVRPLLREGKQKSCKKSLQGRALRIKFCAFSHGFQQGEGGMLKKAAMARQKSQRMMLCALSILLPLCCFFLAERLFPAAPAQQAACHAFRAAAFFGVPALLIFGPLILRTLPGLYSLFLKSPLFADEKGPAPRVSLSSYAIGFLLFWLVVHPSIVLLGQYRAAAVLLLFAAGILLLALLLPLALCFFILIFQVVDKKFALGALLAALACYLLA